MDRRRDALRVAIVRGTLFPEQLHIWRACCAAGVELTLIGTDHNPYKDEWPWQPGVADDVPTVVLQPLKLRPRRTHLWWVYPQLAAVLDRLQPEIVHARSESWAPLVWHLLLLKKLRRVSSKIVVHGDEFT